jgi:hypothetical protein
MSMSCIKKGNDPTCDYMPQSSNLFFMKYIKIEDSYALKTYRMLESLINHLLDKQVLDEATAKNIVDPDTSVKDKLDAINSDIQLNITLLRLEYEGSLFIENFKRNMPLRKTDTIDQGILKP